MRPVRAGFGGWTRRGFLLRIAGSGLAADHVRAASDWRRFADPSTEFDVYRLTDPAYSSYLPAYYGRAISRRGDFLLFSCDRSGSLQAFRMDLKSGECRQLTEAAALDGSSPTLVNEDRAFCFFDGPALCLTTLSSLRKREVYRVPEGWRRHPGFSVSEDGVNAVFAEAQADGSRLRLVHLAKGGARTVIETSGAVEHPVTRPRRAQILYRQGNQALWLVNFDGMQNRKLRLANGALGPARWAPDGKTILYLNYPDDKTQLHTLREHLPDQNIDRLVSKTSQFVHFACNTNTSVFVGASENRAAPHVLLLLRMTRRELTLCEHRASNPATVAPIFSPDSQRVFFQSDKHGKSAIYRVQVDRFVEKTES